LAAPVGSLSSIGRVVELSITGCSWCVGNDESSAAHTSTMTAMAEAETIEASPAKSVKKVRHPSTTTILHKSLKGPQEPLIGLEDATILSESISVGPVAFAWIHNNGDIPTGWHCTHVFFEHINVDNPAISLALKQAWSDNFFCTNENLHVQFSSNGPIEDQNCAQIYDDSMGGHVQNAGQHYLCIPLSMPYDFSFYQYGKMEMSKVEDAKHKKLKKILGEVTPKQALEVHADPTCLMMTEPKDIYAWDDNNFVCIAYAPAFIEGGIAWGGTISHFHRGITMVECNAHAKLYQMVEGRKMNAWWELTTVSKATHMDAQPGYLAGDCVIKTGPKVRRGGHAGIVYGTPFFCGDGFVNTYNEQCDDGNNEAGDGCSDTCQSEAGYYCTQRPQDQNHCVHIAKCDRSLPDRCECTLDEGFCTSRFESGNFHEPRASTIYDFYTCQSCCADAIDRCAVHFDSCPHDVKAEVKDCNKKCVKYFAHAKCDQTNQGREWWERLPISEQHVAGAKMDLLLLSVEQEEVAGVPLMMKFKGRVKQMFNGDVVA